MTYTEKIVDELKNTDSSKHNETNKSNEKTLMISDIDWDIKVGEDVDTEEERKEIINSLPQKVELPIIKMDYWECDEYGDFNADWDYIDYISEEYGWLINSCVETII